MTVFSFDLGHATAVEAEHWLHEMQPVFGSGHGSATGLIACTHLIHGATPRVTISLELPHPALPLPGKLRAAAGAASAEALAAAQAHSGRRSGRAVIYPGVARLTWTLTVEELLAVSAIERIAVIGAADAEPAPQTVIDTRDFVRPQWLDGRLTLTATAAPGGRIAPFEVPNPTPCCADH
jgi:hypothetical protein